MKRASKKIKTALQSQQNNKFAYLYAARGMLRMSETPILFSREAILELERIFFSSQLMLYRYTRMPVINFSSQS